MNSDMSKRNFSKLIAALIDDLPEKSQQMLSLYYVDDMTLAEIARIMELPLDVVEKTFHSASNSCIPFKHPGSSKSH